MISDFTKIAIKNMKKRRLRSFLTLIGILIAIATIFVLISISIGLRSAVQEQFRQLGTDKFFIQPRGQIGDIGSSAAASLTEEDAKTVKRVSGVRKVTFFSVSPAKVEFRKNVRFTSTIGIDLDTSDLLIETQAFKAEEGHLLGRGDEGKVMIGIEYKNANFIGKPISVGDKITINGKEFGVKGILQTFGNSRDDKVIYMPLSDFRTLFNISQRVDTIVVQVNPSIDINDVANRTEKKLISSRNLNKDHTDFTILTPEELLNSFGAVLNIITAFLLGVAAISLIVGGVGIANTMFTSVLERTKEIGVMKAIGAQNKDILTIFLIEAGLLGLVGGVLGVTLGIAISYAIQYIAINQLGTNLLQAATPWYLILGCLLFALLSGALSGLWPAYRATKIRPVQALRYE